MNTEVFYVHLHLNSLWYASDGGGLHHDPIGADHYPEKEDAMARCPEGYEVRRITLTFVEEEI